MAEQAESIRLEYIGGGSYKFYTVALSQVGNGWVLYAANGRIGSPPVAQPKITTPVAYIVAKTAFNKLVHEKLAKGYKPKGEAAVAMVASTPVLEDSGLHPALLNEVGDAGLKALVADNDHLAQPKHNGENRTIDLDQTARGINRKGQVVPLPEPILAELKQNAPAGRTVLCGEQMSESLFIICDVRYWDGQVVEGYGAADRIRLLYNQKFTGQHYQLTQTAFTPAEKRKLLADLKAAGAEGIVFKDTSAPFAEGRPASGGPLLKYKFWKTADVIVGAGKVGKRSVAMLVFGPDGERVSVGNVTIPVNYDIPAAGQVVEVKYLYAHKGGSLYQPQYRGVRTDKDAAECVIGQLQYKDEGPAA